jgi:hypothetical protein
VREIRLDKGGSIIVLLWKKKTDGRPRRRCEDNIKVDYQEVGWGMDLIDLAQNMKG